MNIKQLAADPMAFFQGLIIPSAHGTARFAVVMAAHQQEWFEAIAPSLLAVAAGQPPPITRFWSERTKGASKDSDCACVLLWLLAFSPRKLDMQVGAADRDQAHELKKAATDILRLNDWLAKRVEAQSWQLVCKATGSVCDIVATDVAGSHGARPDVVVMNELSHVTKEEFSQNLLDNATKKPLGLVIICTNAGFENTWQAKWRGIAQQSPRWHFHKFDQPAPWISQEELEEAAGRNSRSRLLRLYYGHWPSTAGDALDADDLAAAVDETLYPMHGKSPGWFFVGGLDLGIKQDHSALVVVGGHRETQQLRLAYAQSWQPQRGTGKVDLIAVERALLDADRRFGFATCGYDPYQAALMAQRVSLQRVKMQEMTFTGANLNLMASTLLDVFRSRTLRLYRHSALIADLQRLTIEERSYGYRLSATRDERGHADLATALAIALPIAIELLGRSPVRVGAVDLDRTGGGRLDAWERRRQLLQQEFDRLADGDLSALKALETMQALTRRRK